jgi:peptide-methionine (R)-S-oxide reductase
MTKVQLTRRGFLGAAGAAGVAAWLGSAGGAGAATRFEVVKSPEEWRRMLGPKRYPVLREAETERPGSSPLLNEHRSGTFSCAGCGNPLFSSRTKFESGTGWPSFWQALPHAIVTKDDNSMFMHRTEVLCRRCGGHLGHLFEDGPKPTGLRYCMNGLALAFRPA